MNDPFGTTREPPDELSALKRRILALEQSEAVYKRELEFEQLISDLSSKFVSIPPERVDSEIGLVLAGLREGGRERDTLVVLVSDHGDMDSAHRLEHKSVLYEEATRVPLVLSLKGVTSAGAVDREHLASTGLDLIPTLCDFAGIDAPSGRAGRSLRPLALGRSVENWRDSLVVENEKSRLVLWDRYKYIVYASGKQREQVIDLQRDPGEMTNLARDDASRPLLLEGRRRLRQWYQDHNMKLDAVYIVD